MNEIDMDNLWQYVVPVTYGDEDEPGFELTEWYVDMCDKNLCAAALLSFFEQVDGTINYRKSQGEDVDFWQEHSMDEVHEGVNWLWSKGRIRKALKFLESKGWLQIERRSKGQKKKSRYLLLVDKLNEDIEQWERENP